MTFLAYLAALGMVIVGGLALINPALFSKYTQLKGTTALGTAELRGAIGGMYAALGLTVLFGNANEEVFLALGVGWVGVLIGKGVSVLQDKLDTQKAMPGIIVDGVMALCFLLNADIFF